ncbi:hypothetical protein JZ751_026431 [Albula glossodonta]|uniref:Ig-like domain-containing protein n=1 Tax=Albula glossodonta TaxID=121402 RepID=A0A8T2PKL8_9TELE|nr:hypothetical protein JZ751_026431 [Albula glossodonta]
MIALCFLCLAFYPYTLQQRLNQQESEKVVKMGAVLDLMCSYSEVSTPFYFFWYQQFPRKPPIYLLQRTYLKDHFQESHTEGFFSSTLDTDDQQMHLLFSSARTSDTAAYLCAVNHKSEKHLQFANGTRVSVLPERESSISAYLLRTRQSSVTACVMNNIHPGASTVWLSGERVFVQPTITREDPSYSAVAISPDGASNCTVRQDGEMVTAILHDCLKRKLHHCLDILHNSTQLAWVQWTVSQTASGPHCGTMPSPGPVRSLCDIRALNETAYAGSFGETLRHRGDYFYQGLWCHFEAHPPNMGLPVLPGSQNAWSSPLILTFK